MIRLGVNVDHVATMREARKTIEPDPVIAAGLCELAGAQGITVHLREDRRHIQDRDVMLLRETVRTRLNLEMALHPDIIDIALSLKPDQITIVPERREEVTTEGGMDVVSCIEKLSELSEKAKELEIDVSFFINPEKSQIEASAKTKATHVEFHTGSYANARGEEVKRQLDLLVKSSEMAHQKGLRVNAGHGIDYWNVTGIRKIPYLEEVNIGHSILSRAIYVGLSTAVKEMYDLLNS
jgi:pyridoxine 5-phosphate synthase